jgi:hypothetical protein
MPVATQSLHADARTRSPTATALLVALGCAALLFAGSMPLPWHHRILQTGGYVVVRGIDGDNWLIAFALIAILFLFRFARSRPTPSMRWLLSGTVGLALLGMFVDYVDWRARTAQAEPSGVGMQTYFGPGFYLGLAGVLLLVVATVLAWRAD